MPRVGLPRPQHWRDKLGVLIVGLIFFGGIGALCVMWAVVVLIRGEYLTAIVMAGFAVFLLNMVLAMGLTQFGRVSIHGRVESGGTELRVDRVFERLVSIAIIALIPSGIVFVCFAPIGRIDIPLNRGAQIFFPLGVAFMVYWSLLLLCRAKARGGWGYLRLTPDRFELVNVFHTAASGSWDDVIDVTDKAPPDNRGRFPAVMIMKDRPPEVINGLDGYTPRGRALYWMIRHYWLHPENRTELTNGEALDRLRAEDFEVE